MSSFSSVPSAPSPKTPILEKWRQQIEFLEAHPIPLLLKGAFPALQDCEYCFRLDLIPGIPVSVIIQIGQMFYLSISRIHSLD